MRFLHRIWAFLGGYFWLPCPICGKMFGGHEITGIALYTEKKASLVCPNFICQLEAQDRSIDFIMQHNGIPEQFKHLKGSR